MKFQIPSTKFQIISNDQIIKFQKNILKIRILEIGICFGFRIWDLGFVSLALRASDRVIPLVDDFKSYPKALKTGLGNMLSRQFYWGGILLKSNARVQRSA